MVFYKNYRFAIFALLLRGVNTFQQYNGMIIINVKENESIDKALKRFKKKFEKTGIMKELRARTFFEKPSVRKRNIRLRAAYRQAMLAESNKS